MESPVPLSRRFAILAGMFLLILLTGVLSMQIAGGTTGDMLQDFYLVLSFFVLEGGWVFNQPSNLFLKALIFIAPLFTIFGILEIFTRRALTLTVQVFALLWVRGHVVIFGLSSDSLLLIKSLKKSGKKVSVIEKAPDGGLALMCRRLGVPIVETRFDDPAGLIKAGLHKAGIAVSFVSDIADSINLVFAADEVMSAKGTKPLDLWLNLDEAEFGRRLGDYLKFASLSDKIHPRFFNLNEVAARQLVRKHPFDPIADAFEHERLHIAVYGFGNFAYETIEEILLQQTSAFSKRPKITILVDNPKKAEAKLYAFSPEIKEVADISVKKFQVYTTGIANRDYERIPEDVTAHLICYPSEEIATAVALSLRSLLLTKPPGVPKEKRRLNAPICVRLSKKSGIARLLRSHAINPELSGKEKGRGDIPDGIFAFGVKEDCLAVDQDDPLTPTVVDLSREKISRFLHYSYVMDKDQLRELSAKEFEISEDVARDWEILGPQYRESCRQEADHMWVKARLVGHRLVAKTQGQTAIPDPKLTRAEEERIAIAEHHRWMVERQLAGWRYHKKRVDEAKRHNLLRPWDELSENEASLDIKLAAKINAAANQAGLAFQRELVIGVVGHRFAPGRPFDVPYVRAEMTKVFRDLIEKNPGRAPVLLTHLADGADTIAAEVALDLKIPFVVPLPLPFETYHKDFEENGTEHVDKFLDLIALADSYFEMPLKFGDLVDLANVKKTGEISKERNMQYALGGAYIAERADEMIAVWDGNDARGLGGTGDIVRWRKEGKIPKEFESKNLFSRHVKMKPAIIINPAP